MEEKGKKEKAVLSRHLRLHSSIPSSDRTSLAISLQPQKYVGVEIAFEYRNYYKLSNLEGNSVEFGFKTPSNPHQRNTPMTVLDAYFVEDDQVIMKRASMYRSSQDIQNSSRTRRKEGKREVVENTRSCEDEGFLSFEIVDVSSLSCEKPRLVFSERDVCPCDSLQDGPSRFRKETSDLLELSFRHLPETSSDSCGFCLGSPVLECGSSWSPSFSSYLNSGESTLRYNNLALLPSESRTDGSIRNTDAENDEEINYGKEKRSMFDESSTANYGKERVKTHRSTLNKMLDPILKPNSTSLKGSESSPVSTTDRSRTRKERVARKSLLNDFAEAVDKGFCGGFTKEILMSHSLPAHLNGTLKLEPKNGPSFDFSLKDPGLVLSAMAWKTSNYSNTVYTFHKNKNGSGDLSAVKNNNRRTCPMIGQMHVSCYLCSEVYEIGSNINSIVTEFILYDIPQTSGRNIVNETELDVLDCYPWTTDLYPHQEIAAIIIQTPLIGSPGLRGPQQNISDYSNCDKWRENDLNMKVVASSGRHGLPNTKGGSPSSLLDRWRSGGGCDCGGWDMACPIFTIENSDKVPERSPESGSNHITSMFFQGKKEELPAIAVLARGAQTGEYSVTFHAQLSALQAFAICIAMLYGSGTFSMAGEGNKQGLDGSNTLKFLLEKELRLLIGAVAEKENTEKTKKEVDQIAPSFQLDPPFSPIGRV